MRRSVQVKRRIYVDAMATGVADGRGGAQRAVSRRSFEIAPAEHDRGDGALSGSLWLAESARCDSARVVPPDGCHSRTFRPK